MQLFRSGCCSRLWGCHCFLITRVHHGSTLYLRQHVFVLSLLTADLWSVLFSVEVERMAPSPHIFASSNLVLRGLVLYEIAPSPAVVMEARAESGNQNNNAFVDNGYVDKQDDEDKEERTGIEMNDINIVI